MPTAGEPPEVQSGDTGPSWSRAPEHCAPGLILRSAFALSVAAAQLWSVPASSDAQILGNDALPYAEHLSSGRLSEVLTPHHPLHQALAWVVFLTGRGLGLLDPGFDGALQALRWVSALGAGAAAAWIWAFATRCLERWSGLCVALGFAGAAGNWLYGAVGETYLPAAFALTALLAGLLEAALHHRPPPMLRTALWLFLACALRQDAVLVAPIVLLLAPKRVGVFAVGLAGVASLGFYLLAHQLAHSGEAFVPWLRGLADTGLWGGPLEARAFPISLAVTQHALHYGLRYPGWPTLASLLSSAALLAISLLFARPDRALVQARSAAPRARLLVALMLFAGLRLVFFAWWQPGNMEYHTTTWVPLFLAALVWMERGRERARPALRIAALATWAAAVGSGNWVWLIEPNRGDALDLQAKTAIQAAGADPLIVSLDVLESYVALRAAPAATRLDASPWMSGLSEAPAPAVRAAVQAQLADGKPVLLLRESLLMERLGFPANPIDAAALKSMTELASSITPLRDRPDAAPYALILRR